jgi:hypothetical protein
LLLRIELTGLLRYNKPLGVWTTAAPNGNLIGTPSPADPIAPYGTNLKWDVPGSVHVNANGGAILKKKAEYANPLGRIAARARVPSAELQPDSDKNQTAAVGMDSLVGSSGFLGKRGLSERQLGSGSFLDARVYSDALGCALPEYDACFLSLCLNPEPTYGPYDGDLKAGSPTTPYPSGSGAGSGSTATTSPPATATTHSPTPTTITETITITPTVTATVCHTTTTAGAVCTLCDGSADLCTSIGPPAPTQTDSNPKGSTLCKSAISGEDCINAYHRYDENRVYNAYTSYTFTNEEDAINVLLDAEDGCAAIFTCDDDAAYAVGMAGWAIIEAFDYMYENDGVDTCGSAYLSNGCRITANACSDCLDTNVDG